MTYFACINLAHIILAGVLSLFSIYFCINVLFRKSILKNSVKLSPTITLYFGYVFVCSLIIFLNFVYLMIFWRPSDAGGEYNAYLLYFGGLIPALFYNTNTVAETFLCFERCLSLIFHVKYSSKFKKYFAILTFFGILVGIGIAGICNKYFEIIPVNSKTACISFTCLSGAALNKNLFAAKATMSLANISLACLLAFLIKRTIIDSKSAANMNKTVFILIVSTTFIEFIPFVCGYIFIALTGELLIRYTGPFGLTTVCFNTTLSVALYFRSFKKISKCNNRIKAIHVNQR